MDEHGEDGNETAHHGDGGHADGEETGTEGNASGAHESGEHAASGANGETGGHGDSHSNTGVLHLILEVLQIVLAALAVGAVVLAGRVYGGEIGRALQISGVGVGLFALQRLWHNFHELGFLASPPAIGEQSLFILASGALALGYLSLYRTMSTRLG